MRRPSPTSSLLVFLYHVPARYLNRLAAPHSQGACMKRCWAGSDDPLMLAYHDTEWGVPLHGARELFAKLVLDGFQAGLSWAVILHKRARFLEAFDGFDPERMARYDAKKIRQLLRDPGIAEQRSEEHTSELQSPCNLVCRLLLEKK